MAHLSPPTLTESRTQRILRATGNPGYHAIHSLALDIVGPSVGDA